MQDISEMENLMVSVNNIAKKNYRMILVLISESTFGKVPVILYKGEIIPESLITSDYVDEVGFKLSF